MVMERLAYIAPEISIDSCGYLLCTSLPLITEEQEEW